MAWSVPFAPTHSCPSCHPRTALGREWLASQRQPGRSPDRAIVGQPLRTNVLRFSCILPVLLRARLSYELGQVRKGKGKRPRHRPPMNHVLQRSTTTRQPHFGHLQLQDGMRSDSVWLLEPSGSYRDGRGTSIYYISVHTEHYSTSN